MDIIKNIFEKVNIQEGKILIEKFLLNLYFNEKLSTKELSQILLIPIPIVTAIKKEGIKANIIEQSNGISLTNEGRHLVENEMGYKGIDKELYRKILNEDVENLVLFYKNIEKTLAIIKEGNPTVDVTIDQSHCTLETSIKRVIIALKNYSIIGKNILCIGDDDLISVTINIILKFLYNNSVNNTKIYVIEKDKRIVDYINKISEKFELKNIVTIEKNLIEGIDSSLKNKVDCVFTDPPYTLNGLELFLSRGLECLKHESGLNIFLSYSHKSQDEMLKIEALFYSMGLAISEILLGFNSYDGAELLGSKGQLIVLKTTQSTKVNILGEYNKLIYTGEIKKTRRKYRCKNCNMEYWVGVEEKYTTIEKLKLSGCLKCHKDIFELVERRCENVN